MNMFLFILNTLFHDVIMSLYIVNGLVNLYIFLQCLDVSVAFTSDFFKKKTHITVSYTVLSFITNTHKLIMYVRCLKHDILRMTFSCFS